MYVWQEIRPQELEDFLAFTFFECLKREKSIERFQLLLEAILQMNKHVCWAQPPWVLFLLDILFVHMETLLEVLEGLLFFKFFK